MLKALFRGISFKKCVLGAFASMLLAFGLYHIHAQSAVTEGGILGLSLFFDKTLSLSPAITATVLNLLCYLFGFRVLGREFVIYSAITTATFSISYAVFESFPPLFPTIGEHPLLAAIAGALFVGVGCGICVRIGGAPSGDDALAMSASRLLHVPIAWIYLVTDLSVLSLSLVYIPLRKILYSLLTVTLSGQLVGLLQKIHFKKEQKMTKYKIIATDLDGTLLNTQGTVSPENLDAIHKITKMGAFFVPSSGRAFWELPPCVRTIPDARYFICSDGAVIYDTKAQEPLDDRSFRGDAVRRALDYMFAVKSHLLLHHKGHVYVDAKKHNEDAYIAHRVPPSFRSAMYELAVAVDNFEEFCYGLDSIEMVSVFFADDEGLNECRARFLADGEFSVAATEPTNIEIFHKDAGKGNALDRLAQILGADRSQTIAVGDNINDLDNFAHAGLALAMENGVEEAKKAAHRTICKNDEHAMVYILEHILK